MHVSFTDEELGFQQEVRTFLHEEYPDDIRQKQESGTPLSRDDIVRWQKILFEKGWAALNWPVEHGGTGWTTSTRPTLTWSVEWWSAVLSRSFKVLQLVGWLRPPSDLAL